MAQFSRKERVIASVLSSSPRLKALVKKVYITLSYCLHRKGYKSLVLNINRSIQLIEPENPDDETFFGYYDKSPENNNGLIIFNETSLKTYKKPSTNQPLWIKVSDSFGNVLPVDHTFCYTWQQGCRAQWVSDHKLIYNIFDEKSKCYKSALYNCISREVEKLFAYPVQDSYEEVYFLSINYARIMNLRPDYGYRNLPLLSDDDMNCLDNDGIWKVDFNTGHSDLVVSLKELTELDPKPTFKGARHKVNHVMISPDGKGFIFIHRWYVGLRRFDRLVYSDFNTLNVLAAEDMVSHMCWIDNDTVFGYLRLNGTNGFYYIDINSGAVKPCETLTDFGNGDGHPSAWGDWIVIDTYPDKSRLQHLFLYNRKQDKVYPIVEVFQAVKYQGESRCDMHPRFSPDGRKVYFDTVFTGRRRLACIDVSSITSVSI